MKFADQLRAEVARLIEERNGLLTELDGLAEFDPTAAGETRSQTDIDSRVAAILERGSAIKVSIDEKNARITELDNLEAERNAAPPTPPQFLRKPEAADLDAVRTMNVTQLTDTIARAAEEREIDPAHARIVMRKHRRDTEWLRNLAARSTDAYVSAFQKIMTNQGILLTDVERAAIAVGTNTQGGYMVPTFLDPTLILTNTGGIDVIRPISRVVSLTTGNKWNGVSTAGVTASWDGELAEVSDDSPSFGAPSVPTIMAQAFVQASIAAFEDIDGLASDVLMLIADARVRLEAAAHATGNGSTQPRGIFTALDANTNVEIVSTTAATLSVSDLQLVKRSVGIRWRRNGKWLMNPYYADSIRNLGTSLGNAFSAYLPDDNADSMLGRGVVESEDAPSAQTTTVRDNQIVFGDFQNYLIVDKPGSTSIDFVPVLFNTANNLPDGRRGWYAHWRTGADSINDVAFRLYQDKTSA